MKQIDYVSVKKMREIDRNAIKYGIPVEFMMENAGKAIAFQIKKKFPSMKSKIICVAGKGNNGGGVISAARHLTCFGRKVTLILIDTKLTRPSKFHYSLIRKNPHIKIINVRKANKKTLELAITNADIIVDGLFGTGISRTIREPEYSIISMINNSKSYVISNDVPSGINPDTGKFLNISVKANFVVVLHKPKRWMEKNPKQKFCVASIGIPPEIDTPFDNYFSY